MNLKRFFVECVDGFYNINCSGICGSCVNGEICEKHEGHCVNGCKTHYKEPLCKGIFINNIFKLIFNKNMHFSNRSKL